MTVSNLLSNKNTCSNQLPSEISISKPKDTRLELSVFQTAFEAFDKSILTLHSPESNNRIDASYCNQPQHICRSKLSSHVSYCDISSMMNRYFDDADDINESHAEESCAQTFSGKGERNVGVARNSTCFGLSRALSYDPDVMRRNGEIILEAVQNFSTPFHHPKTNLGRNFVANDKILMGGELHGKAGTFEQSPEVSSDDEDSLDSIFDEPVEVEPNFLSGSKRSYEDSFLSLVHVLAKTSFRRDSSTYTLTNLVDQIGCLGSASLEEKAKALFQNSRVLIPLAEMGDDSWSPFAKPVKVDYTQGKSPGTIDCLKRMCRCMKKSAQTMEDLQEWDRKNGLPKSHSQTMVNSSRSREQLQSGMVLQKWNGVPLLSLPGAKVKVIRRTFRGLKVAEVEE